MGVINAFVAIVTTIDTKNVSAKLRDILTADAWMAKRVFVTEARLLVITLIVTAINLLVSREMVLKEVVAVLKEVEIARRIEAAEVADSEKILLVRRTKVAVCPAPAVINFSGSLTKLVVLDAVLEDICPTKRRTVASDVVVAERAF